MTRIQWTDETWNPVRGCSIVSEGCRHCYAMRQAHRFSGAGGPYEGLTRQTPSGPKWTGKIRLVPEVLDQPLRWRKPRRVFVNSMSDLFHEEVPDEFIDKVFAVMARAHEHTFQILTKRPERMRGYFERPLQWAISQPYPLPNVWLGISCEDQATADERIPLLLQTPAAVRFLSCEPLLGPIDLYGYLSGNGRCFNQVGLTDAVDWVIVGGESGPGARPIDLAWVRVIVEFCRGTRTAVFVKQLGADPGFTGAGGPGTHSPIRLLLKDPKGGDPAEWPEELRVRQFPVASSGAPQ
jgi:protein gp37